MKTSRNFILPAILLIVQLVINCLSVTAQNIITNYKVRFATADDQGKNLIILRQFEKDGKTCYLTVNPQDMTTKIMAATTLSKFSPCSLDQLKSTLSTSPYIKALIQTQAAALPLQNAGITHGFPKEKGITLTIDLCPSHKGLDRNLFTSIINAFQYTERPVPVALSLTGRFSLTHQDDMQWLKSLVSSGKISITWVNHTYNHYYNPSVQLNKNFLLAAGTDIDFEILGLEVSMLREGLMPSVFFRFPGLISDQQLVDKISSYGLIPIGSDAWLAKGQQAKAGSLVLIHGNGNEPIGVQDFIKLLGHEKTAIKQQQWLLYDLTNAISNEF
jgi:hypothetical protein